MEDAAHEETGMIKVDHQRAGFIRDVIMKDEVNLIRDVYEEHEDDGEGAWAEGAREEGARTTTIAEDYAQQQEEERLQREQEWEEGFHASGTGLRTLDGGGG